MAQCVLQFGEHRMLAVPEDAAVLTLWLMENSNTTAIAVLYKDNTEYKLSTAVVRDGRKNNRTWKPFLIEETDAEAARAANVLVAEMNTVFHTELERIEIRGDVNKLILLIGSMRISADAEIRA